MTHPFAAYPLAQQIYDEQALILARTVKTVPASYTAMLQRAAEIIETCTDGSAADKDRILSTCVLITGVPQLADPTRAFYLIYPASLKTVIALLLSGDTQAQAENPIFLQAVIIGDILNQEHQAEQARQGLLPEGVPIEGLKFLLQKHAAEKTPLPPLLVQIAPKLQTRLEQSEKNLIDALTALIAPAPPVPKKPKL